MFHKLNNLLSKGQIRKGVNLCKKLILSNNLKSNEKLKLYETLVDFNFLLQIFSNLLKIKF